jgi:hypothetical protein
MHDRLSMLAAAAPRTHWPRPPGRRAAPRIIPCALLRIKYPPRGTRGPRISRPMRPTMASSGSSWLVLRLVLTLLAAQPARSNSRAAPAQHVDVLVYGASGGGILAAIAAAQRNHSVLIMVRRRYSTGFMMMPPSLQSPSHLLHSSGRGGRRRGGGGGRLIHVACACLNRTGALTLGAC